MKSFITFLAALLCAVRSQEVQSPCPDFFQYHCDDDFSCSGIVEIPPPKIGTTIKVQVNLSLRAKLSSKFYGSLKLNGTREQAISSIIRRQNIQYLIEFPIQWPIPKVTAIILNNQVICSGPPEVGRMVMMIKLEHVLYTKRAALKLQAQKSRSGEGLISRWREETATQEPPKPAQRTSCGSPLSPVNRLIVGGSALSRGEFPWLVAIFTTQDHGLKYICGGTLISSSTVVTAAHCTRSETGKIDPANLVLMLGKFNLKNWVETNTVTVGAKEVLPHPSYSYDDMNFDADIALIELKKPVDFNRFVSPVCLWEDSTDPEAIVGSRGTVVGWGRTSKVGVSDIPRKLELPIVSEVTCLRSDPAFQFLVSNRTFCAGSANGAGPCNGDSGGGLFILKNSRWFFRGVISASLLDPETKSCDLQKYTVFTDVAKFATWISQNTRDFTVK